MNGALCLRCSMASTVRAIFLNTHIWFGKILQTSEPHLRCFQDHDIHPVAKETSGHCSLRRSWHRSLRKRGSGFESLTSSPDQFRHAPPSITRTTDSLGPHLKLPVVNQRLDLSTWSERPNLDYRSVNTKAIRGVLLGGPCLANFENRRRQP